MNQHDLWVLLMKGKPRLHATGFAQLYIAPDVRLHVWSDELFKHAPDVTQVAFFHDHRFTIESHVLRGALLDQPAVTLDAEYMSWALYEVRPAHEGEAEKPVFTGELCGVRLPTPRIIKAGSEYCIDKRTFHATRALEPTVTVMRKHEEEDAWARLLVPNEANGTFDPVHSLIKQPSTAEIMAMMWKELLKLGDEERAVIARML